MPVVIHRGSEWRAELANVRHDCIRLQHTLFESCCRLQHDPATVNLQELADQVSRLKAAQKRKLELEEVANWVAAKVQQE